jgi:hypothetical protein
MDQDIDLLEIASGLKDALINSGLTIESILHSKYYDYDKY